MIKRRSLIMMLVFILVIFVQSNQKLVKNLSQLSHQFYVENTFIDTGSKNIVTGIYLDYRVFDSIFEASILLIVVTGIIFISTKDDEIKKTAFIFDKQVNSPLLITFSRLLYPFMLVFGIYIIMHGHLSPGGGFQGGAILATAILITYYIDYKKITNIHLLINVEKVLFIFILLVLSISYFTKGFFFTNFSTSNLTLKTIYLYLLNFLIGFKVSLGLVSIFTAFLKEGRS